MPTSVTRTLASEVLETRGGTLCLPKSCIEVTVFCQDWPCWVQVLTETRGFKCVKVFHSHLAHSCLVISGTGSFAQEIVQWTTPQPRILICLDLHQQPPEDLKSKPWVWQLLSHHQCRGVTTARFWCGTNQGPVDEPPQMESSRRVKHCIKPLHTGKHHPPPADPDAILLATSAFQSHAHQSSFYSLTAPRMKFLVPSVFSPTRWAIRPLTTREIATCCDVKEELINLLPDTSIAKTATTKLPFMLTTPAKLIGTFLGMLPHLTSRPSPGPTVVMREPRRVGRTALAHMRPLTPIQEEHSLKKSEEATLQAPAHENTPRATPLDMILGRNKAAKNDDAAMDYGYWDKEVVEPWKASSAFIHKFFVFVEIYQSLPLVFFRHLTLRVWRRNIWKSFCRFMQKAFEDPWTEPPEDQAAFDLWPPTVEAARDCIRRCMVADWWEWLEGSRLLFWRWPHESQPWARDSLPIDLVKPPLPYRRPQPKESDPTIRRADKDKFDNFRRKGYV
jgi:hypothetical protein